MFLLSNFKCYVKFPTIYYGKYIWSRRASDSLRVIIGSRSRSDENNGLNQTNSLDISILRASMSCFSNTYARCIISYYIYSIVAKICKFSVFYLRSLICAVTIERKNVGRLSNYFSTKTSYVPANTERRGL